MNLLSIILSRFDYAAELMSRSNAYDSQKDRYKRSLDTIRQLFTPVWLGKPWAETRTTCLNPTLIAAISMASVPDYARFNVPSREEIDEIILQYDHVIEKLETSEDNSLVLRAIVSDIRTMISILNRLEFYGNLEALRILAEIMNKSDLAEKSQPASSTKNAIKALKDAVGITAAALIYSHALFTAVEGHAGRIPLAYELAKSYFDSSDLPEDPPKLLESPDKFKGQ